MLSRLFIDALWSSEGKRLTSWLLFVMFIVILLLCFPFGILGQVCYLIVSISNLYFNPLYSDGFSHTYKFNKDEFVPYR